MADCCSNFLRITASLWLIRFLALSADETAGESVDGKPFMLL
jgi:hypothetical protein